MKNNIYVIWIFLLISNAAFSQGFSIEHFDEEENWRFVREDKDGRIVTAGFYKPSPVSTFSSLEIRVYSPSGQLLNKRNFGNRNVNTITGLAVSDTSYVVFYTEARTYTQKWFAYSAHFNLSLQTMDIQSWGDTSLINVHGQIRLSNDKNDWLVVLNSGSVDTPSYKKATIYRMANDLRQVKKFNELKVDYDSTLSPVVRDLVELPQDKGYGLLLNGQFVSTDLYHSNLFAIALLDTGLNLQRTGLTDIFGNQTSANRMGVVDFNGKGGIAVESDTSLTVYGCAYYYNLNSQGTNLCLSDTCMRQIRSSWKLSDLSNLSFTLSAWTGKPAYYESVSQLNGFRHLVSGSLERDDKRLTSNRDYQTTITLEEFNGGQRLLRRLLLQNGYWFRPFDIIKARNGDYIMLARYNDFLISGNAPDKPMLTRVDSAGQFMVFSENLVEVPLKVWPNPVHGRILRMELPEGNPCQVALLDVQGRSRWVGTRSAQDSQLDLSDTPSGIYFLRITQPGQPPRVTKVVLP